MNYRTKFDKEMKNLKYMLIDMASTVEKNIQDSITSFLNHDTMLAREVAGRDYIVNEFEKKIEQLCLNVILKEQPVARDLRFITAILKMITDLERVGDHSKDISNLTIEIDKTEVDFEIVYMPLMTKLATNLLLESINSFVNQDLEQAKKCLDKDDEIDQLFDQLKVKLIHLLKKNEVNPDLAIDFLMIGKYLEKIGDHATNIAEWVIFSITGEHKDTLIF